MTEEQLRAELKQGIIRRVYYLHGKETFLVDSYAKRIMEKCFEDCEPDALNFVKFKGLPDTETFAETVETLPVFADRKVIMVSDFDIEKTDDETAEQLIEIVSGVSDMACIIIYMTNAAPDLKKPKTKKLISAIEGLNKKGKKAAPLSAVLNFEKMTEAKIAEAIVKRAKQLGCEVTRETAVHLARMCLRDYSLVIRETEKLCAYVDYKGEIKRSHVDMLTEKKLEPQVFKLADEIKAKRGVNALLLLNELFEQGNDPIAITAALSLSFIDMYRARTALTAGIHAAQVVSDFNYPQNRAWAVGKTLSSAGRLSSSKVRGCIKVLADTDYKLKSSPLSNKIILERAVVKLLELC